MPLGECTRENSRYQIASSSLWMIDHGLKYMCVKQGAVSVHSQDPFTWIFKCAQPKPLKDILEGATEHFHAALAQMGDK